jgi:hypothetical protein
MPQIMMPLIAAAISALVAWVFKLDDRVFTLSSQVATREDVVRIEEKISNLTAAIIEAERTRAHPKTLPDAGSSGSRR